MSLVFPSRIHCWNHLVLGACSVWALFGVMADACSAQGLEEISGILKNRCYDCHSGDAPDGGLDLKSLGRDLTSVASFAVWERAYDRIATGEMPPPESGKLSSPDKSFLLSALEAELTQAHRAAKGTVLRRLNRREYENTLNDLFGTNLKLADHLPPDGRSHEFENIGEALGISMVQLQKYMDGINAVLDESIQKTLAPPERKVVRASYADTRGAEQWLGKIWLLREDGAVVFFADYGYPTGMLREANVRQDGWYKIRVNGYAYQSDVPITFSLGATTFARGVEQPTFGYYEFPPGEATTVEIRAWLPANYMIDVTPYGIVDENYQVRKQKDVNGYRGPGLAVKFVEVEGPLTDEFLSRGHQLLFEGLSRDEIVPRNPKDREKPWYKPAFEIKSGDALADVTPVLKRVAVKAFRRPVTENDLEPYLALFQNELESGSTIEEALRTSVTALFCAPEFLYLQERPGKLDDYAIATRLAYFLTRTAPDEELLEAAARGQLSGSRDTLRQQAERLLADPRSERFIRDFTDAWLNLREIEFTNPDAQLFPEFDPFLKFSMLEETRAFFRKLLDENLGVRNIVKSDFAMLNSRLGEHYGIAGVDGPEIRHVSLPEGSVRGGFLSQGSVLKVSANGNNTSPVVRGVWVMERILGQTPPPPPPGIPGVEPDVRGATTLRELLDRHRNVDSCRSCHQMIDPPGFALESFDPVGTWRERFRSLGEGERVNLEIRGQKVRYKLGPPVDASGQLPDGRTFDGYVQFRDLLAEEEPVLGKALTTKFLTFATGRDMGFSDRPEIRRIVEAASSSNYGVRDLLLAVITSEIFLHK